MMGEFIDYIKEYLEVFGIWYLLVVEINFDFDVILLNINEYFEEWVLWFWKYM